MNCLSKFVLFHVVDLQSKYIYRVILWNLSNRGIDMLRKDRFKARKLILRAVSQPLYGAVEILQGHGTRVLYHQIVTTQYFL